MSVYLYPYKSGSESAKALAEGLGIKRIALEGSKFKGSPDKTVINWGASSVSEEVAKCRVLNKPEAVAIASDKRKFFDAIIAHNQKVSGKEQVYIPSYTINPDVARIWLEDGAIVIARTVLNGHSGRGIVVMENIRDFVDAPLYTYYIPKKQEYRVHVAGGEAVDIQRKARREDVPDDQINWRIRNHDNGFIFARNEGLGDVPPRLIVNAVNSIKAIGLDFGAADVIYNERSDASYVLEVNTAPGLSGETLDGYVKRMSELTLANEKKPKAPSKRAVYVSDILASTPRAAPVAWGETPTWTNFTGEGVPSAEPRGANPPYYRNNNGAFYTRRSAYIGDVLTQDTDGRYMIKGGRISLHSEVDVISWLNIASLQTIRNLLGQYLGCPPEWSE